MEPEAPVEVSTLEEIVGNTIARPRAISMLVAVFALIALALAAVGVYGVMAYSVRERTQEIGIRMALGATTTSVCGLVLGQALRLAVVGVATGVVAAALLTRLLERLLYERRAARSVDVRGHDAGAARRCHRRVVCPSAPWYADGSRRRVAEQLSRVVGPALLAAQHPRLCLGLSLGIMLSVTEASGLSSPGETRGKTPCRAG